MERFHEKNRNDEHLEDLWSPSASSSGGSSSTMEDVSADDAKEVRSPVRHERALVPCGAEGTASSSSSRLAREVDLGTQSGLIELGPARTDSPQRVVCRRRLRDPGRRTRRADCRGWVHNTVCGGPCVRCRRYLCDICEMQHVCHWLEVEGVEFQRRAAEENDVLQMKHLALKELFLKELVEEGILRIERVPGKLNVADVLTKELLPRAFAMCLQQLPSWNFGEISLDEEMNSLEVVVADAPVQCLQIDINDE